jgi:hypothetical protein
LQKQLVNAITKSDWPKFSGQGEYDHMDFIHWIDTAKRDSMVPDKVIFLKLLTILEGVALSWYKSMRLTIHTNNWTYWRQAIINKFSTSNWKRKKQLAFEKDRFVPGETAVADWVTCQYKRLIAFEPNISPESINFKLFGLVSGEVEYAAKTAMPQTGGDISTVINVLEDIVDETRLSRYRNQPRLASAQTGKPLESNKTPDKQKASKELKCWVCNTAGNTSRSCPKKINTVQTEACSESDGDDLGSDPEDPNMIIGLDLTPTLHIAHHRGRNNLVEMSCGGEPCRVLLDSRAVRSVVSESYLSQYCRNWKDHVIQTKLGRFHSALGNLTPLGAVRVQLCFRGIRLLIVFVVMENLTSPYFILGNDYLVKLKIVKKLIQNCQD